MATGATGQLGLALPVQGELSGTWGDTVNNGITQYTNIAIAGTLTLTGDGAVTLSNTTGDASASNIVSTLTGAGTVTAQFAIVKVTGTLTTAKIITAPSYSKTYLVVNAATGSTVSFIRSGQTPAISIAVGESALVYFNGTDYVKVAGTTSGAAAGSNTQVQFNSSGVLAGSANMTFDGTNLTVGGSATATRFIPSGSTVATNGMYLPAADTLGFSTASTERMRIRSDGAVGIGGSGSNSFTLNINRIPTATTSWSAYSDPTISATVTTYNGFESRPSTIASSFTVGTLQHYVARQGTIGATSAVTSQFGYAAHSSLTGATNNYGFYGDIASGTGRFNLFMAGTADNSLAGPLGIGSTVLTGRSLRVALNNTGSTSTIAIDNLGTVQSDVTVQHFAYGSVLSTAAAAFTLTDFVHYRASSAALGAGSAVTNQYGFAAQSSLTTATNNYGFYGNLASGTGRWNFYANGTAANYMAGALQIGPTAYNGTTLAISKNITGDVFGLAVRSTGQIQSDVTTEVRMYDTNPSTVASAFTLASLSHFKASQGTFGAGSTVTTQAGFNVESSLTGATNNYGFYGNIASGTGRYNLYMQGTATNYFAGNVGIATTSPGSALDVKGTLRLSGATSGYVGLAPAAAAGSTTYTLPSADGSSGQFLSTNGSGTLSWATGGGGGASAATPTALGTVYGKQTTSGGTPYLTAYGYNAGAATTGINNVFMGVSAGEANVAGTDSIAIGYQAMKNYSGADGLNIAIGSYALTTATTGSSYYNIAIGYEAMKLNTSGYNNIAIGFRALLNNTSGRMSVAVGHNALKELQTGNDGSTAVGADCLSLVTTGIYNVGVGGSAISSVTTGSYNTAMGYGALGAGSTTTSSSNVAIGYNALVTTGAKSNNVAVGRDSLYANTTGANNVAIGRDALGANTTTSNLTAVGYQALLSNTTGEENTAVGYQALYTNTTNYRLTALGWKAGFACTGNESVFIGYRAGQSVSSGVANTLVGPYAGEYQNAITTGSNNVVLGYAGGLAAGTDSNEIFINTVYNASGKGSSTGFINPNGGGVYQGNNSSSWSTTSDQRLKKNIVDNNVGLDAINSIRVRNFEYRVESEITELSTNCAVQKTGVQLGVIAQELQAVLPECVKTESTGVLSVDTDNLTWYLVNAVKQLKAEFDAYKASHP